jgi:hypothetical protein
MAKGKIIAIIFLVVGIAMLLASALADIVGLGGSPHILGYKQIAGIAVGALVAIVGAVLYWRGDRPG